MQFQLRAHHDHRTTGIVHALAEQVLTEPALLALEHIGQRFQRTLVGAGDHAAATAIVEQGVDGFLQHPLFVADDDVRRAQLDQALEAVVPVDDAAIQVVEVRRGEPAAVQRDERAQFRRNDRHDGQDHPFRLVAGKHEGFDELGALGELFQLQFGAGLTHLLAHLLHFFFQIHRGEDFADRFRADAGGESVLAVLVDGFVILFLGEDLVLLKRGQARFDHHIAFKVEHALHILEGHVQEQGDPGRQGFQEPDVSHRRSELDMAHALAAHARQGDFNAALLADDALVLDALVLAAQALIVLDRAEDTGAEQAVTLGLERAVVDGFGLLHLAERPGENLLRAGQRNPDPVEGRAFGGRIEDVHDLLVHGPSP